ncbi:hypothetical protein G6F37_006522 [Rhizopus arrhizus]|nr:hypothetical protein G6F38_006738 [Rhizopus arrhizus]KAG1157638.1 hypothetical protein G6F37_006522 [Rhizopus arrhizus]
MTSVHVSADDLTDPVPSTTFAHLDPATVSFDCRAGSLPRCRPVVWILVTSVTHTTRSLPKSNRSFKTTSPRHHCYFEYEEDKLVKRAQKIQYFLFQPFAQVFTGHESRLVKLKTLLHDHLEGDIKRAEKLAKEMGDQ